MKKLVLAAAVLSMIATPAMANHNRHYRHHNRDNGAWVGPVIGGLVLGAIIAGSARNRQPEPNYPVYRNQVPRNGWVEERVVEPVCQITRYYDNYGRLIERKECW